MRAAIAALVLISALGGCGFQLAGSEHLPAVLAKPYLSVKDPYTDFAREFERSLKSSGALLQLGRQDATATIEVTRDLIEQRTLAVSARNIPTD
jgi:outer membrane lipopolysaccharide assembly protein LptE/RlpB